MKPMLFLTPVFAALLALAGCADPEARPMTLTEVSDQMGAPGAAVRRAYASVFQDSPFEDGAIKVIASERGELRSFTLVPCVNGTRICAGSPRGPRGNFQVTPDYFIVTGLYGRTFILSPGGNGGLRRGGYPDVQLAWEHIEPIETFEVPETTFRPVRN